MSPAGKTLSKINSCMFAQVNTLQRRVTSFGSDTSRETRSDLREEEEEEGRGGSDGVGASKVKPQPTAQEEGQ